MNQDQIERILRRGGQPGRKDPDCPDPTRIAGYVTGTLSEPDRLELEEHLADCTECLARVGLLARAEEEELPRVPKEWLEGVRDGRSFGRSLADRFADLAASPRVLAPVAAGLVVVAGLLLIPDPRAVLEPETPPETELRSVSESPSAAESPRIVSPRENEVLGRSELEFHWRGTPGALDYEVQVTTAAGDPVWEERTDTTWARPPESLFLEPGRRYFVWVRARGGAGDVVSSPPIGFELAGT